MRQKIQGDAARGRPGLLDELERLWRRVRAISLAAPVLLFLGFGLGKVTTHTLTLSAPTPTRATGHLPEVPRIQIEALSKAMGRVGQDGQRTVAYVALYKEHVAPVEQVLRRRGVPGKTAREVAWPLVVNAHRNGLDPATVASVLLVESEGNPHATSRVGARGLMQVMPGWVGQWRGCGRDLYDIQDNLCTGTNLLAWYLRNADGDEKQALLGYNGCVHGTNTPNCHVYPDRIARLREEIKGEIRRAQARPVAAVSR